MTSTILSNRCFLSAALKLKADDASLALRQIYPDWISPTITRKGSAQPRDTRVAMQFSLSRRYMVGVGLHSTKMLFRLLCWILDADSSAAVCALMDEISVLTSFGLMRCEFETTCSYKQV
ncbi:uncharacterized protein LOC144102589 [Amblyomma americanum]